MTITFLAPDGVPVTAKQERQAKAPLNGGGAGRPLGGRSGFKVDTASDIFTVTSTTWTLKPCAAQLDPGASTGQGMYGWATDENVQGTKAPADDTLPRKDIAYIQVNDDTAGDSSGEVSAPVEYLEGVPSVDPQPPGLPERSFLVATITVPQVGGGSPTVVLNPARFVAAGSPQPVSSDAERDALDKYLNLQVIRKDKNGRIETWNGTVWWYIGMSWSFSRGAGSDASFTGALTGLVTGTIVNAPAGRYLIEGDVGLYGATSAIGRTFVATGPAGSTVYYQERQDLTNTASTYHPSYRKYVHAGGNLVITTGYSVVSGTAACMSATSGETTVTATLISV